jgi:hypothetical protein
LILRRDGQGAVDAQPVARARAPRGVRRGGEGPRHRPPLRRRLARRPPRERLARTVESRGAADDHVGPLVALSRRETAVSLVQTRIRYLAFLVAFALAVVVLAGGRAIGTIAGASSLLPSLLRERAGEGLVVHGPVILPVAEQATSRFARAERRIRRRSRV